jgi:protein tyrosine phosphatase (PTP) superfamily phosphohydrolase (DUF442 family)
LQSLRADGFEAVINLLPETSRYAIAAERALVEQQGLLYIQIPVQFDRPTQQNYQDFVAAMDQTSGLKTLVHCAANYRASAFYAIYASQYYGWSQRQAQEFIESVWRPAEHPPWAEFIAGLLQ